MRSISKIKSVVDKRLEDRPLPVKKMLKTPASVRDKQKKDDDTLKLQKQLIDKLRALQKAITKGNKDLGQVRDRIAEKTESAIKAGDEIIDAAQKRAKNITGEAHNTKGKANGLLHKAEILSGKLDSKEKELKELDVSLDTKQKGVDTREKVAKNKLKAASEKDAKSLEKLNQTQKSLDSMLTLLLAVIEKVIPIAENSDDMLETISTNIAKADKMYLWILDMENAVRIEKEVNDQRSKELDSKEIWLNDRVGMLGRVEREIKG